MSFIKSWSAVAVLLLANLQAAGAAEDAAFTAFAKQVDARQAEAIPVQSQGRVKPIDTFARESILFITGKYSLFGLTPTQMLFALTTSDATANSRLINVRSPELRTRLGLQKSERRFTLAELEGSPLEALADPILKKPEANARSVSPDEKEVLEAAQQLWLMRAMMRGSPLLEALNLDHTFGANHSEEPAPVSKGRELFQAFGAGKQADFNRIARELDSVVRAQRMPGLFRGQVDHMGLEMFYNRARIFFWVGIIYLLFGIFLLSGLRQSNIQPKAILAILSLPILAHLAGFGIRVAITGFAPVTNMYGTMIWVSFGIVLFGTILYLLYGNRIVQGLLLAGGGLTLLLTESIPLVLSPDMNPIVAVLRNNFWLTIHVLTITISYAAFTVAMLIGNYALIQKLIGRSPSYTDLSKLTYRVIQLGVFLLTIGIILGGWWADYSWGRFWGWDPKETWALIADLGFLAILHARFVGWLGPFGVLAASPAAYLLVIMAWYGVNFILAAGLHSYGFSSGGATLVLGIVVTQVALLLAVLFKHLAGRRGIAHSQ